MDEKATALWQLWGRCLVKLTGQSEPYTELEINTQFQSENGHFSKVIFWLKGISVDF